MIKNYFKILAALNYINMITANSLANAKKTGVRHLLGARQRPLASQYLAESLVYVMLSAILASLLSFAGINIFNDLAGTTLAASDLYGTKFMLLNFGSALVFALINGLYPAYFLTSFKLFDIIRQEIFSASNNYSLRKVLVVFQFTFSIIMIIAVAVVRRPLHYIYHQNQGYDRNEILTFSFPAEASESQKKAFLNNLSSLPGVGGSSISNKYPGEAAAENKLVESYLSSLLRGIPLLNGWRALPTA